MTARDTHSATASASFPWFVQGPLTASNPGNQTNPVGVAISPVQVRCLGGFPPCWFFQVTGLPPGLSLVAPGQIGGTPTTVGVYTVTFTVKDTRNVSASTSWTWTITR